MESELMSDMKYKNHPGLPNLFIIGASKCGTSALHSYLNLHPDIRMGDEKEPCFFVAQSELVRVWPVMANRPVSYDWNAYLQNFSGGENKKYRGEGSTLYSMAPYLSGVPERIKRVLPNSKIIYLVREPVKRTIGHYWQEAKEFHEKKNLKDAIKDNKIYIDTSDYVLQINEYLKFFDSDKIKIVLSEDLKLHRRRTLSDIFSWLQLDPYDPSEEALTDRHVSPKTSRRERVPGVSLVRDSRTWASLRKILPSSAVGALRRVSTKQFDKSEYSDIEVQMELINYFSAKLPAFEAMIGREVPEWKWSSPPRTRAFPDQSAS